MQSGVSTQEGEQQNHRKMYGQLKEEYNQCIQPCKSSKSEQKADCLTACEKIFEKFSLLYQQKFTPDTSIHPKRDSFSDFFGVSKSEFIGEPSIDSKSRVIWMICMYKDAYQTKVSLKTGIFCIFSRRNEKVITFVWKGSTSWISSSVSIPPFTYIFSSIANSCSWLMIPSSSVSTDLKRTETPFIFYVCLRRLCSRASCSRYAADRWPSCMLSSFTRLIIRSIASLLCPHISRIS